MQLIAEVDHERKLITNVVEWPDDAIIVEGAPVAHLDIALAAGYTRQSEVETIQPVELWKLRAACTLSKLDDKILKWMGSLPEPQASVVKTAWEYMPGLVSIRSETVSAIAQGIGLDDSALVNLWKLALGISLP